MTLSLRSEIHLIQRPSEFEVLVQLVGVEHEAETVTTRTLTKGYFGKWTPFDRDLDRLTKVDLVDL